MKIVLLGFGGIGQETLNALLSTTERRGSVKEVVIICRNTEKYSAVCEDILDGLLAEALFSRHNRTSLPKIVVTDDYRYIEGAGVILCCYGVPSTFPMHDRQALLDDHVRLSEAIFSRAKPFIAPGCHIINAVNPVDSISYYIDKILLDSRCRVIGIGAAHNTARLLKSICRISGIDMQRIDARSLTVCGEHGAGLVPLLSQVTTDEGPLNQVLSAQALAQIVTDTRNQGLDIFHKMRRPPKYGPSASILILLERIIQRDETPCCGSVWLPELGVFMSWPLALRDDVFTPLSLMPNQDEQQQIHQAALKLKNIIQGFS
ncbi:TPA: malate dehydrogenase [Serratia marcescens]|uniref:lactate/malate family dehydrogenase n=1 Tax=Serratia marcescens TaxID=615 RepID=UPI00204052E3|nr:malate dehydrogenase [Serratia marcescens]MCM2653892.1 malate dehydrogenase [Serratia marcescens]HDG0627697.1 malate dehydrogenase [Serratia marcescens]